MIARLSPAYRSAFQLRDVQGLSTCETAPAFGITPTAVKSRLRRARLQMRKLLKQYFESPIGHKSPAPGPTDHRPLRFFLGRLGAGRAWENREVQGAQSIAGWREFPRSCLATHLRERGCQCEYSSSGQQSVLGAGANYSLSEPHSI